MTNVARPKLIAFVSDVSARTQFILPNQVHIESLPFDGIVVNIPASWSQMSAGVAIKEADVREWLAPLSAYNANKQNYLAMEIDRPGDLFDNAAWAQVATNWGVIGKVAAETGFKGILFDNEEYAGKWQNFPEDVSPADAARGLEAYQTMSSQRGKEVMAALAQTMPNADIAVAHGPYVSVPGNSQTPNEIGLQVGDADLHELQGAFFTGMVEGLGPNQHILDAGEIYALRSAAEFKKSFDYRNEQLPALFPWKMEANVRANWSTKVDQAHMIYSDEFPEGYKQTPASLAATLLNAFDHSENAVFLYSEMTQLKWLSPNAAASNWIAAVKSAVELADHTQRGSAGKDALLGKNRMDRLIGEAGNDKLSGGNGDDVLIGGNGRDMLDGGAGADRFHFNNFGEGGDALKNFGTTDILSFDSGGFANVAKGDLSTIYFWSSKTGKAHDADDRFLYNTKTDALWFDADGTGAIAAVMIVDFKNNFNLTAADITIF